MLLSASPQCLCYLCHSFCLVCPLTLSFALCELMCCSCCPSKCYQRCTSFQQQQKKKKNGKTNELYIINKNTKCSKCVTRSARHCSDHWVSSIIRFIHHLLYNQHWRIHIHIGDCVSVCNWFTQIIANMYRPQNPLPFLHSILFCHSIPNRFLFAISFISLILTFQIEIIQISIEHFELDWRPFYAKKIVFFFSSFLLWLTRVFCDFFWVIENVHSMKWKDSVFSIVFTIQRNAAQI